MMRGEGPSCADSACSAAKRWRGACRVQYYTLLLACVSGRSPPQPPARHKPPTNLPPAFHIEFFFPAGLEACLQETIAARVSCFRPTEVELVVIFSFSLHLFSTSHPRQGAERLASPHTLDASLRHHLSDSEVASNVLSAQDLRVARSQSCIFIGS